MQPNVHDTYRSTAIQTADRGKLVVMVYDYCIQWCEKALEANGKIEIRAHAIGKAQAGITELTCALDFDAGGDIAKNLWRLYDFMGWALTESVMNRSDKGIRDVLRMLTDLRSAWHTAAEEVRKNQPELVSGQKKSFALVG
ncbi:MAG: flagellar protein FliS [Fibrobacterota bacterium]|nr:flagellar protein FliS [Fibrobacterota bacterium]QQS06325.1 MAG: flagellar protein FliS [Fibrobacterota bacterium]